MSGADDLFSTEAPAAPPADRLHRAAVLLALALPLNVFGIACFTSVPGAVLALLAWQTCDDELTRISSGALPAELRPRARRLRDMAFALLVFSAVTMTLQVVMYGTGVYGQLLERLQSAE